MPDNELEVEFGDLEPIQSWGPEGDHQRELLLNKARELLADDAFYSELNNDTLANHIIEYTPDPIPYSMRIRLRDLYAIESLSPLPEVGD